MLLEVSSDNREYRATISKILLQELSMVCFGNGYSLRIDVVGSDVAILTSLTETLIELINRHIGFDLNDSDYSLTIREQDTNLVYTFGLRDDKETLLDNTKLKFIFSIYSNNDFSGGRKVVVSLAESLDVFKQIHLNDSTINEECYYDPEEYHKEVVYTRDIEDFYLLLPILHHDTKQAKLYIARETGVFYLEIIYKRKPTLLLTSLGNITELPKDAECIAEDAYVLLGSKKECNQC